MQTRKVVYNNCYGGFGLSLEATKRYLELKGYEPKLHEGESHWDKNYYIDKPHDFYVDDIERHDPHLVQVVEELGEKANGDCSKLTITTVYGLYRLEEYDGLESVFEQDVDYDWH